MAVRQTIVDDTYYPAFDGEPMAETPDHARAMVEAWDPLIDFFRHDPSVYVGIDQFIYDRMGDATRRVAPDVFVARGVPHKPYRRIYKVWEEGRPPCFVLEVTSRDTAIYDQGEKLRRYHELGVPEVVLYDPLGEYLQPRLRGFQREEAGYRERPVETRPDGTLVWFSAELGLELHARPGEIELRFWDPRTGSYLPTNREARERARQEAQARELAEQRAEGERLRAEREAKERALAEQRAEQMARQVRALQEELDRLRRRQEASDPG